MRRSFNDFSWHQSLCIVHTTFLGFGMVISNTRSKFQLFLVKWPIRVRERTGSSSSSHYSVRFLDELRTSGRFPRKNLERC